MKSSIVFFQFIGFLFVSISGVLLHYAFDWSGNSILIAPFSSVNESIWEHMKLMFVSLFVYAIIENHVTRGRIESFWCIKLFGVVLGIFLIPMFYYTYTCGLGITADWVNIATFFVVAAIVFVVETIHFGSGGVGCGNICGMPYSEFPCLSQGVALVILVILASIFVVFTFMPPNLPIFDDPVTGTYGFFARI